MIVVEYIHMPERDVENSARKVTQKGSHHYHLVLPANLAKEVEDVAKDNGTTFTALVRRFVVLGLKIESSLDRGGKLIKKEADRETELLTF